MLIRPLLFSFRRATHLGEPDYGRQLARSRFRKLPYAAGSGLIGPLRNGAHARRKESPFATEDISSDAVSRRPPKQTPTTIGNHKLQPATLMMGYGYDPALHEGSLKPPIFLTSTFVFENAEDGKRFFEGVTGKRPAAARRRADLFALQRPQSGNPRGPAADLGGRRGRADFLQRHDGDRQPSF